MRWTIKYKPVGCSRVDGSGIAERWLTRPELWGPPPMPGCVGGGRVHGASHGIFEEARAKNHFSAVLETEPLLP